MKFEGPHNSSEPLRDKINLSELQEQYSSQASQLVESLLAKLPATERRNIALLASYLEILPHFPYQTKEIGAFNPLKSDGGYVGTDLHGEQKVFYPLYIGYNSESGSISSPPIGSTSESHSYILVRSSSVSNANNSRDKVNFRIDVFDPGAQGQLMLMSENVEFPDHLKLNHSTFTNNELSGILGGPLQVFARRIQSFKHTSDDFGQLSLATAPFRPQLFRSRNGDAIILDSIIGFNNSIDAIQNETKELKAKIYGG